MDDQLHQVQITADQATGTVALDGSDISNVVSGYLLSQQAGKPAELFLTQLVKDDFEGLARVVVGVPPDPGPAAAAFLSAIDAGELEKNALSRHDLMDGGPHELTRAMLRLLSEWASGSGIRKLTEQLTTGDFAAKMRAAKVDVTDAVDAVANGGSKMQGLLLQLQSQSIEYEQKVLAGKAPGSAEFAGKWDDAAKALQDAHGAGRRR
ncbi:hypothetical protein ACFY2M_18115 [Streptomyces sp. NPDC001276]|uniref:hypothetical protein n=1 Tax=Streptomyces sp. NPDC001276 TaxID=3364555 RepID=UPI0036CFE133